VLWVVGVSVVFDDFMGFLVWFDVYVFDWWLVDFE